MLLEVKVNHRRTLHWLICDIDEFEILTDHFGQ